VGQLLEVLYRTPGYIDMLANCADDKSAPLICWFVISITLKLDEARNDPKVRQFTNVQSIRRCRESPKLFTILAVSPDGTASPTASQRSKLTMGGGVSIEGMKLLPGGRHDNDHMDFRKIKIVPTPNETAVKAYAFTPLADDGNRFLSDKHAHALDYHFRLLREDFVRPLKKELARSDRQSLFCNARFVNAVVKPLPCIMVEFDVPVKLAKTSLPQRVKFWEEDRMLVRGSLVCLLRNGTPVLLGRIALRDTEVLASQSRLGLTFKDEELVTALTQVNDYDVIFELVPVSPSFFSYEPILRCLQHMSSFPFAEELLDLQPPKAINYHNNGSVQPPEQDDHEVHPKVRLELGRLQQQLGIQFDRSQEAAIHASLRDRVSLIQGPPGTGKTFLGVLISQVILNTTNATILCVCYTNHALDQFLEALLDRGVKGIVRLGGRTKNERIQQLELRNLAEEQSHNAEQKRQWFHIKTELNELESQFEERVTFLKMDRLHWRRLSRFLEETDPGALGQLTLLEREDGFDLVGENGKKAGPDYLWIRWSKGKDSSPLKLSTGLWSLGKQKRKTLMTSWLSTIKHSVAEECSAIMLRHQELSDMKRDIRHEGDRKILAEARVIGCTTHGATTRKELLRAAGATVLVVEEAAEILEAHVITSISDEIEQIIMIGDHQQLRPKAECYELTVEADKGCALNTSMFERLVCAGFRFHTLLVQHRMRPEISNLVRDFPGGGYPGLKDAPEVEMFPSLRGVQKNVVFVHHTNLEEAQETMFHMQSFTKVNKHEVQMVVAVVKYLLQQQYLPEQLVVLTPYGSQLKAIRSALAEQKLAVVIDDMDLEELHKAGEADGMDKVLAGSSNESRTAIRVATVDNYQGEEADVVVASLVRSNPERQIGHLQEPERVNVLLSRAKHGLILIGNMQTLSKAKVRRGVPDVWRDIREMLHKQGCIFNGLPAVCQKHPREVRLLATTSEFASLAPDGGCTLPCDITLSCGHKCPRCCHSHDPAHKKVLCLQPVADKCSKGHVIQRACCKTSEDVLCQACEIAAQEELRRQKLVAQKQKEAVEHQKKQVRDDAAKEIERLKREPIREFREDLSRHGITAEEYHRVVDRVENYMQSEHGLLTVSRVEKLFNTALERAWYAAKKEMSDPSKPSMLLFHGTDSKVTDLIASGGFKLPEWKQTNMYGQGVYFATDSTKSANPLYTKNSNRLLLCDVLLGDTCTIEGWKKPFPLQMHIKKSKSGSNKGRNFLDVDLKKVREQGFDSVFAVRDSVASGGVKFDEYIIYNHRLALPRYIVHYIRGCHLPRPPQNLAAGTRHVLKPVKNYDPTSPEQVLYRLAESQFLRMLANRGGGGGTRITKIEYYVDPKLERGFEKKKREYDDRFGPQAHETRLVFHGTRSDSVDSIMHGGFRLEKVGSATDSGWYGAGIYFSEQTAYSIAYDKADGRLILCQLLLGKPAQLTANQRCDGKPVKDGFTSHVVNDGAEIVMFDMDAVLPTYIVHYSSS
jgi:hypothetical protein